MRARSLTSMVLVALVAAGCSKGSGASSTTSAAPPPTTAATGAPTTNAGGPATTTAPGTTTAGSATTPGPSTAPSAPGTTTAPGTVPPAPTTRLDAVTTTTPSQADAAVLAFLKRFDTDQEMRTQMLGLPRAALAPNGAVDQLSTVPPGLRTASFLVVTGTSGAPAGQPDAAWKVVESLAGLWGVDGGGFRNEGGQVRVGLRTVLDGVTIDTPYDVMAAVAEGRFGQAEWAATTNGE